MKILFVTATRVGDAVLSTGLLNHLIVNYPKARITIACGPAAAPIFESVPNLERLIVLDKMLLSLHWVRMWFICLGSFWDMVVDLRNAPMTYILPTLIQKHLGRPREEMHRIVHIASVVGLQHDPPSPKMWLSSGQRELAMKLIPDTGPVLAIGATANWDAKMWAPEKYSELIERLSSGSGLLNNCRVALFGRDDERPKILGVIESIPANRRLDFVGNLTLMEVFACLKRCHFFVGNDSGLMHIAAVSGIPTLGLFGPSKEALYAPWGDNCSTVRTPESFDKIHPAEFNHRKSASLMGNLTVDTVEAASKKLLSKIY